MKHIYYLISTIILLSCFSCSDDEVIPSTNDFQTFVSGKYFYTDKNVWLKQTENGWQEYDVTIDTKYKAADGGVFWFTDGNTLLTPAVLGEGTVVDDNDLRSKWAWYLYEKGEELALFVKSTFRYDPATGSFSTDNLAFSKEGYAYYIEQASDKKITMRVEFVEPVWDFNGLRKTLQEELSPDLHPNFPYKVFNSNDEAIAYVKEVLGE